MTVTAYTKTIGTLGVTPYYRFIDSKKQSPITSEPLPYYSRECNQAPRETNQYPLGTYCAPSNGGVWQQGSGNVDFMGRCLIPTRPPASQTGTDTPWGGRAKAYNKARAKFLSETHIVAAQGLTALAERKKTMEMVNNRLLQLWKAAMYLRKGELAKFCKTLGIQRKPKHQTKWSRPKDAGSLWLEYWMGWAPTVGDIYSLVDAYTNEINPDYVKAGAGSTQVWKGEGGNGSWKTKTSERYKFSCHIGALVEITNYDLLDLNEAGLLNPPLTFYQTVPFSWLLGWFVNLEQVLSSLTDTVGLSFKHGWITEKTTVLISHIEQNRSSGATYGARDYRNSVVRRQLFTELPAPTVQFGLPNGLSASRGATLSSLILQFFAPLARTSK